MVTGGARNLGRSLVLALARSGYDVVVNAKTDAEGAERTAAEARALGVSATAALADVADPDEVGRLFEAVDRLGPLRVLVNNAALRTRVPLSELMIEDWQAVRSVTLDGAMHCALTALPRLRATDSGRIVTMIGGNALRGDPGRVHVSAAKHGLVGMTKALAAACADDGITVNAVSPGKMRPDNANEQEAERRRGMVAQTVAFLASAAAFGVTGQLIEAGPST
ncbi:SDR family NAD(P)-dependent oxidoreductase [Mycobacterium sp. ITM-2016-00317]|uniref:SDR family NAD(P)-dependent oxidoreductase n=1 Tax=Mycobacterium sp. ITM-2016-00317 TaxID=2099694 RepID=UPI00287F5524|nr:SDR family NAD(P)-dependent oxidoreductase [Mycobacterium sp. ITM-2016-00317]WNG86332.1 SDR family NAD(P)-dependent oxidoreductase [Mycobacterium sp. ITM-2016-00317]